MTRYLQPGLELIALDPKRSASIVGPEAFESDATMADVARRLACDVGTLNQEGCAYARVVYVLSGTDPEGLARLDRLGELIYEAMLDLPEAFSTKPLRFDPELRGYLDAQRLDDEWYRVIGGEDDEGRGRRLAARRAGRLLADPLGPGGEPRAGRPHRAG